MSLLLKILILIKILQFVIIRVSLSKFYIIIHTSIRLCYIKRPSPQPENCIGSYFFFERVQQFVSNWKKICRFSNFILGHCPHTFNRLEFTMIRRCIQQSMTILLWGVNSPSFLRIQSDNTRPTVASLIPSAVATRLRSVRNFRCSAPCSAL